MIKKLFILIKNYDKIMALIDEKPKNTDKKYSTLNVPKNQLEIIEKMKKGV